MPHSNQHPALYPDARLLIGGERLGAEDGAGLPVVNPGTGQRIGIVPKAGRCNLQRALAAA